MSQNIEESLGSFCNTSPKQNYRLLSPQLGGSGKGEVAKYERKIECKKDQRNDRGRDKVSEKRNI
jgi:hypothetical protein